MNLVTKSNAPKCHRCGRALWHVHWEPEKYRLGLGWVKRHRQTPDGPECWGRVACIARRAEQDRVIEFARQLKAGRQLEIGLDGEGQS